MKDFEYYITEKKVKKQKRDENLAEALKKDAIERINKIKLLDKETFSKIIFENIYDAIRDILDAILILNGYKSYSHEASITYLKKLKVPEPIIIQLDEIKYKRNSSKYYGKNITTEDTKEILNFLNKNLKLLMDIYEQELQKNQ